MHVELPFNINERGAFQGFAGEGKPISIAERGSLAIPNTERLRLYVVTKDWEQLPIGNSPHFVTYKLQTHNLPKTQTIPKFRPLKTWELS